MLSRAFYVSVAFLIWASHAEATPGLVQAVIGTSSGSSFVSSETVTLTAIGSHDLVVGACISSNTVQTWTVTDDKSNSYIVNPQTNHTLATFYLANVTNGPTVITCAAGVSSNFMQAVAVEYSGIVTTAAALDTLDFRQNVNPGSATDAITCASSGGGVPTGAAGELAVGIDINEISGIGSQVAGTGYTMRAQDPVTWGVSIEDKITGAAGSTIAATYTDTTHPTDTFDTRLLLFKAAVATGKSLPVHGVGN